MAAVYTFELVGKKNVKLQDGTETIQCCFIVPDESFEGYYVEKALVPPEVITFASDGVLFKIGSKCKIFWERNSYRVAELLVLS